MKKLLFVISQLYKGGAETALVNLLNNLDYQKYEIDLLILNQIESTDVVSLIDRINENVRICDAYKEYKNISVFDRVRAKLMYTSNQKYNYYFTALDFVRGKEYDWAFHVGEWYSPAFVADEVRADRKAIWIHNDLLSAEYFDESHYFYYADRFDYFIFVSQNSLRASVEAYPFLMKNAVTIYNINDVEYIRTMSEENISEKLEKKNTILLTCANFRKQKNHIRQVYVLEELKRRGINVTWINIGSTTDEKIVQEVKKIAREKGVLDSFLILGSKENPYSYMKYADVVTVLSDYESWSMVITEAKILGKPVIATKTSGALEQIEDERTGLLTGFSINEIADKIEYFIKNPALQETIKKNIVDFDNTKEILCSFNDLISNRDLSFQKKDILYIIDDINYLGGAHIATKLQILDLLNRGRKVAIFSSTVPIVKVRNELVGATFFSLRDLEADKLYHRRICECLLDKRLSMKEKKRKIYYTLKGYRKKLNYDKDIRVLTKEVFSKYPIVCVMSEASIYRENVANSSAKKKIQWIHTDYCDWRTKTEWTRQITKNDEELYKRFDCIVLLTDNIAKKFCCLYPRLKEKIVVNKNIMPVEEIKKKALEVKVKNENCINFITVGRMDFAKAYPRIVQLASKLKKEGYKFTWKIIGNGEDCEYVKRLINENSLYGEVKLMGAMENPFKEIVKADIFALLSVYEGLPNTIFEALILGVPVLATKVGGISSQIEDGISGWLVENEFDNIYHRITYLLMHQDEIAQVKENLKDYFYNNDEIMKINDEIFKYNLKN